MKRKTKVKPLTLPIKHLDHYKLATRHYRKLTREQIVKLQNDIKCWLDSQLIPDLWRQEIINARYGNLIMCKVLDRIEKRKDDKINIRI